MKRVSYLIALTSILLFAWLTRTYQLSYPNEYVFDERYHLPAVRLIANHDSRAFEWWHQPIDGHNFHDWLHPPLAKYIQSWSISNLTDQPANWRLGSVVFGVVGIGLTFVVAQLAFKQTSLSLLAAFLLSLDGLWLVQSRVAMNDIFVASWLMAVAAAYLWYLKVKRFRWLAVVGILLGLALATKWSAAFLLLGILGWELISLIGKKQLKVIPWVVFSLLLIPLAVYILSYLPMFLQGKSFSYFLELQRQIMSYQFFVGLNHVYQSGPWQWWLNLRPVWYWTGGEGRNIYAINNPLLALMEAMAAVFSLGYLFQPQKNNRSLALLFMLYLVSFVPWLASPRIVFYYHYTPAAPLAAILLAYWLHQLYLQKANNIGRLALFLVLVSLVWLFWIFYPHWLGLPTSSVLREAVYFALPSWR